MDYVTPFIKWLLKSDYIKKNKLFFNAAKANNNNIQIVTQQISKDEDKEFVDGSVLHRILFTVFDYKSVQFNQLVKTKLEQDENLENLLAVGNINEFIAQMEKNGDYPVFGDKYEVQKIYSKYLTPSSPSFDTTLSLAKYSIPIICEVLEYAT